MSDHASRAKLVFKRTAVHTLVEGNGLNPVRLEAVSAQVTV